MSKTQYSVQAVDRAVELLEFLAEQEAPIGVSELAKGLGLNKNIVFRLLHTLERHRWVVSSGAPAYSLGLQPFRCFSTAFAKTDLRKAAFGPLKTIWHEFSENSYLAVLDDTKALFMEALESRRDVRCGGVTGGRYHSNCCAPGKVLLAHADRDVVDRIIEEGMTKMTEASITDPDRLQEELEQVVKQGYAVDVEEYGRGMVCFAVPIYDLVDNVVAAIGVTVLLMHYTLDELETQIGPEVFAAAKEISVVLGASKAVQNRFDEQSADLRSSSEMGNE